MKITHDSLPDAMQALTAKLDLLHSKVDRLAPQAQETTGAPELLNLKEVAKYLRKSEATIYGRVNRQTIPHIKQAGKLYFPKSKIDAWLQAGEMEAIEI